MTKCLSTDRTFPQNKSIVKAPVELKTHIELIKEKFKRSTKRRDDLSEQHSTQKQAATPSSTLTDRNTKGNAVRTATSNAVSVIDNEKHNFNTLNLSKIENSDYMSIMQSSGRNFTARNNSVDHH